MADRAYFQVALACAREIARLEGLGPKSRRSRAEMEADRHLHVHVHLQSNIDRWRDAPPGPLLEAKVLADRLAAIHEPVRKTVEVEPIAEPA